MSGSEEAAIERLAWLLQEENAALEALDFTRGLQLLPAKREAAEAFSAATRGASPGDADADALRRLRFLADENRALLVRALRVQQRVIEMVARAARAATPPPVYGASGLPGAGSATPRSLLQRV